MTGLRAVLSLGRLAAVAVAVVPLGCTPLDDEGDICSSVGERCEMITQPITDADAGRTPWGCLENPYIPTAEPPAAVGFAMAVVDFNNPSATRAIQGLQIQVCQAQDFPCLNPIGSNSPPAAGAPPPPVQVIHPVPMQPPPVFAVGVPFGFNGYVRLNAVGYLQTEYYFLRELGLNLESGVGGMPPTIVGETILLPQVGRINEFFQATAGVSTTRNENAGIIALRTFDCLGQRAAGVSLELLSETPGTEFSWVFSNAFPVRGTITDDQGVAGFANVSPEMGAAMEVEGIAPNGERYGRVTVNVRAGTLTFAEVRPARPWFRSPQQP